MTQNLLLPTTLNILAFPQLSIYFLNDSKCVYTRVLYFQQYKSTTLSMSYHKELRNLSDGLTLLEPWVI